ncbi:MAG TPA: hypothetical protein VE690_03375, partial [Rhodopila sp.]|nr:hypothetical protein [Rhodopila sp.]
MIFIPGWITNILLLVTAGLSIYQLRRLFRPNPATAAQFWLVIFCLVMVLVVTFTARRDPWLSLGFFVTALACLAFIIRQHR